ncbi:unnamed protein product [Clonostachys chloroleuca]|uniref:Uncharacterized protein n=1 Tax=Clonostachys chloroleuca TaxID=1926264 RepID=A0AA35QBW1_9HYPO|nr:unnamed protein product [Clonostachys chloroleuca]
MDNFAALLIAYLSEASSVLVITNFIDNFDLVSKVLQSKSNEVVSASHLPTVTDAALWIHNPATFHWQFGEPNLFHLTSLLIKWLCPKNLSKILILTESLKFLHLSRYYITKTGDTWKLSTLNFDDIIRELYLIKHTIEKLRIGF